MKSVRAADRKDHFHPLDLLPVESQEHAVALENNLESVDASLNEWLRLRIAEIESANFRAETEKP